MSYHIIHQFATIIISDIGEFQKYESPIIIENIIITDP